MPAFRLTTLALLLTACSVETEPPATSEPDEETETTTTPDTGTETETETETKPDCPFPADADTDADGLLDCDELELGTAIDDDDSDDDGLSDLDEVERGSDPLDPNTDGDCADDFAEVDVGTDPTTSDDVDLTPSSDYAATVLSMDPLQYWSFNDADGDVRPRLLDCDTAFPTLGDGVTQAIDAQLTPAAGFLGLDDDNLAYEFGKGDAKVGELPLGVMNSTEGTVSMWINTVVSGEPAMLYYGAFLAAGGDRFEDDGFGRENELHLHVSAGGTLHFFNRGSGGNALARSSERVDDGAWHHVGAAWATDKKGNITGSLYVDGVDVAPIAGGQSVGFVFDTHQLGMPGADKRKYAGLMDEVAIWPVRLTGEQMAEQFCSGRDGTQTGDCVATP